MTRPVRTLRGLVDRFARDNLRPAGLRRGKIVHTARPEIHTVAVFHEDIFVGNLHFEWRDADNWSLERALADFKEVLTGERLELSRAAAAVVSPVRCIDLSALPGTGFWIGRKSMVDASIDPKMASAPAARDDARLTEAVTRGEDAFWSEIARSFPELRSGDLAIDTSVRVRLMLEDAAQQWLLANARDG